MRYRFEDMSDPLFMAHMQAGIDAMLLHDSGVRFDAALAVTIERIRYLFGEEVPARLVHHAVRRAYRSKAREEVSR